MSFSSPSWWLTATALIAAGAAVAQTAGPGAVTAPAPVTAPAQPAHAWRSAFDGYEAFADAPITSWRESNDTVGRIGGWRVYAREAAGAASAPAAPGQPPAAAPGSVGPAGHRH